MWEREPLLKTLQLLKPAIASKDIIEEMTHIYFTGEQAIAGNDTGFGICVPCDLDFKGGLRGTVLLGLLNASKAKELELEPKDDGKLVIKMNKTRLVMTPLEPDSMMVEIPKESNKAFKAPVELLAAIGKVMLSAGNETSSQPEQTGITLIKQDGLHVFSSDDATISWVKCKAKVPMKEGKRVILPTAFAEQLLSMSKGVDTELYIGKSYVYAKNEKMITFARLIGEEDPSDLVTICSELLKEAKLITIPARLKFALARTFVLLDKQKDNKDKFVKLTIANDTLKVITTSSLGKMNDRMALEESHPDASINVSPKVLKRALPVCQRMFITPGAMVLTGKDFTYVVAEHE